jgi:hypothetical protein
MDNNMYIRRTMHDLDGPQVSKAIYEALFNENGGRLDPSIIPYTLDTAVQVMKDAGFPPARWATYIHIGV